MTLAYVAAKFRVSSILVGNEAYALRLGIRMYLRAMRYYLALLRYVPTDALGASGAAVILGLLALTALLLRRRTLLFLWFFTLLTPLPIAFIAYRGAYGMYIPAFGVALFVSILIARFRKALFRCALTTTGKPGPYSRR